MRVSFSAGADREIRDIYRWSETRFGAAARLRYERLLNEAVALLLDDPVHPYSEEHITRRRNVRRLPLRLVRGHAPAEERVGRPRHVIFYEVQGDTLTVLRVVHEVMDQRRLRLPTAVP